MKNLTVLLIMIFTSNSNLLAQDALKIEISANASEFLEKKNNLLPFLTNYVNCAFGKRDVSDVFSLYRRQKSDDDVKELGTVIKAQMAVLDGQKIKSISIIHVEESKQKISDFKIGILVKIKVKTDDYDIPINLTALLGNDDKWFLLEELNRN